MDWLLGLLGGAMIGGASALYLHGLGRIAGISGILGQALRRAGGAEGAAFLAGLVAVPALWAALAGPPALAITGSVPLLVAAGLLVGVGTRMGSGCTSGHGVCGLSRLSPRSIVATVTFMAVAGATVFVARHVVGGN